MQDHLNPKLGGQRGEPEALSQPVDPSGVGGLKMRAIKTEKAPSRKANRWALRPGP